MSCFLFFSFVIVFFRYFSPLCPSLVAVVFVMLRMLLLLSPNLVMLFLSQCHRGIGVRAVVVARRIASLHHVLHDVLPLQLDAHLQTREAQTLLDGERLVFPRVLRHLLRLLLGSGSVLLHGAGQRLVLHSALVLVDVAREVQRFAGGVHGQVRHQRRVRASRKLAAAARVPVGQLDALAGGVVDFVAQDRAVRLVVEGVGRRGRHARQVGGFHQRRVLAEHLLRHTLPRLPVACLIVDFGNGTGKFLVQIVVCEIQLLFVGEVRPQKVGGQLRGDVTERRRAGEKRVPHRRHLVEVDAFVKGFLAQAVGLRVPPRLLDLEGREGPVPERQQAQLLPGQREAVSAGAQLAAAPVVGVLRHEGRARREALEDVAADLRRRQQQVGVVGAHLAGQLVAGVAEQLPRLRRRHAHGVALNGAFAGQLQPRAQASVKLRRLRRVGHAEDLRGKLPDAVHHEGEGKEVDRLRLEHARLLLEGVHDPEVVVGEDVRLRLPLLGPHLPFAELAVLGLGLLFAALLQSIDGAAPLLGHGLDLLLLCECVEQLHLRLACLGQSVLPHVEKAALPHQQHRVVAVGVAVDEEVGVDVHLILAADPLLAQLPRQPRRREHLELLRLQRVAALRKRHGCPSPSRALPRSLPASNEVQIL
eukprot:Rhum_TRINITY_DN14717_c6_g2::Rhum_TRINITY_DN14717_c6_g2_i1::g.113873::m.113873